MKLFESERIFGKFIVEFDSHRYLIECDEDVAANINVYAEMFLDWLYDKNNDHGYWIAFAHNPDAINDPESPYYGYVPDSGGKDGLSYGIDEFLKWLNENCLQGKELPEIIGQEAIGAHHIDEFDEWLKKNNLSPNGVKFINSIDEYNKAFDADITDWEDIITSPCPNETSSSEEEFPDPFQYFERFENESGTIPPILKLHREFGIPLVNF